MTMLDIMPFGQWYLQIINDMFYGHFEWLSVAIREQNPTGGRRLEELPNT